MRCRFKNKMSVETFVDSFNGNNTEACIVPSDIMNVYTFGGYHPKHIQLYCMFMPIANMLNLQEVKYTDALHSHWR